MLFSQFRPTATATRTAPERHRRRSAQQRRHPVVGLLALIVLGLLATFFAWVSAEPLWLAVGHGTKGTATVIHCTGAGLDQRCHASFAAAGGAFTTDLVDLVGAPSRQRVDGTQVAAQMVSPYGRLAYAADTSALTLRWALGLALILLCGLGIAFATGAHKLPDRRSRRYAGLASLTGPLLLLFAMLAVTH
jgi:hypothetical protein